MPRAVLWPAHLGVSEKRRYRVVTVCPTELPVQCFRYLQAQLRIVCDAICSRELVVHRGVAAWLVREHFQLEVPPFSAAQFLSHFGWMACAGRSVRCYRCILEYTHTHKTPRPCFKCILDIQMKTCIRRVNIHNRSPTGHPHLVEPKERHYSLISTACHPSTSKER